MSTHDPVPPPRPEPVEGPALDNPAVSHETSDVDVRAILGFVAVLAISAATVHFVIWLLFMFFDAREGRTVPAMYPLSVAQRAQVPPEPRLQTNPREDLRALRADEDDLLRSYRWVDRNNGVVRIPIDEAMKLVVQRGLPSRQGQK